MQVIHDEHALRDRLQHSRSQLIPSKDEIRLTLKVVDFQ